jgi:hypothetical protein
MVNFENHSYPVPFVHVEQVVEVRGCAGKVQILSEGRIVREYLSRGTQISPFVGIENSPALMVMQFVPPVGSVRP